ncbi:cell division protein FtsB [Deinococcus radiophilus]|uniref:Cell division protein FtsB n=2 Tax=Deinococcus radiophilus TaxID=32062 RepID=A0A431W602_9DEIO|nr:cell division protein FtsB [Deinococcus radiophilus]RTR30925.1 cell division protein FtsB [Deinococcus radiophilus]
MLMTTCLLCAVGAVQTAVHLGTGVYRSMTWTEQTREAEAENDRLRNDIQILKDAKVQLNSPQYLEQLARCWGYVGRDEAVLVAEYDPENVGANCDEYRLP